MFKKISLIFVLALLLSSFFVKPVEARAIPVRVPADVEWVDSGIDVSAEEIFTIKAKGKAITGPLNEYPGAISGPEGQETICYNGLIDGVYYECVLEEVPFGALIGRIGEYGSPFEIGDDTCFTADISDRLYLAVNDFVGTYGDNLAGFTVIFK